VRNSILDHVIIDVPKRKISMFSDHGEHEEVNFRWDSEGAEGFTEAWQDIHNTLPEELYTVKYFTESSDETD